MAQTHDLEIKSIPVGRTLIVVVSGPGPLVEDYLRSYLLRFPQSRFGTTYTHTRVSGEIQWLVLHRWLRR